MSGLVRGAGRAGERCAGALLAQRRRAVYRVTGADIAPRAPRATKCGTKGARAGSRGRAKGAAPDVAARAATMGKWLGISDTDLSTVLPNLGNWNASQRTLGLA